MDVSQGASAAPALLFHHVCVQTNDYAASLSFYRDALGMELVEETRGFHGRAFNTWLRLADMYIELQTPKAAQAFTPPDAEASGVAHMCFLTPDVAALHAALKGRGCAFLPRSGADIYEVNGGKLMKLRAPEGTVVEFREKAGV